MDEKKKVRIGGEDNVEKVPKESEDMTEGNDGRDIVVEREDVKEDVVTVPEKKKAVDLIDSDNVSKETEEGASDPVYLSDSSTPEKKMKHVPSEQEEQLAVMLLSKPKNRPTNLLPVVNDAEFYFFIDTLEKTKQCE
ncbi:unnamed protein product [Arabis nemorensis]|uniref:Uncharacterized protein n=1 Tax=Arabis nemorensis TaxID=586526 RepID=A0A565B9J9_9BRAS|nr:unnamed protein product [Arabis nemorensis]